MQNKQWEMQKLLEEKYAGEKTEGFFTDQKRLESGEPLAYVIGHTPFLNTSIHLDSHPLIPRPETEFWVERVIHTMQTSHKHPLRALDLCAGSGCIGVAVLKQIANATVDLVELDERHHDTIKKNVTINDIDPRRARIIGGNLFEHVSDRYDYILTNPPYIDPALDRVETSVHIHEPAVALYGGTGGTECIDAIIKGAPQYLTPDGTLYLEHEPEQTEHIKSIAREYGFYTRTNTDQYGRERYTQLTFKNK